MLLFRIRGDQTDEKVCRGGAAKLIAVLAREIRGDKIDAIRRRGALRRRTWRTPSMVVRHGGEERDFSPRGWRR